MTSPTKFLFDVCAIGKPAVDHLARFLEFDKSDERTELRHVLDFCGQDTWDEQWIPQVARDGWIIISGDRGTTGGKRKGEKLPRVCAAHGVTHVLLSASVQSRNTFEKLLTIVSVWYELIAIGEKPRGSRWALEPINLSREMRGRGKLISREPGGTKPEVPPPGRLFPP